MSNNLLVVGGSIASPGERPRIAVVPDQPVATVSSIHDAPSVRRRRARLRAEDPAMRRVPKGVRVRHDVHMVSLGELVRPVLRVGLGVAALACLTASAFGLGLSAQSSYEGPTQVHHVAAGESVWSLAAQVQTDRSLEDVVADIEALNELEGTLAVGEPVVLPVR